MRHETLQKGEEAPATYPVIYKSSAAPDALNTLNTLNTLSAFLLSRPIFRIGIRIYSFSIRLNMANEEA
jgi:hypothetical protein